MGLKDRQHPSGMLAVAGSTLGAAGWLFDALNFHFGGMDEHVLVQSRPAGPADRVPHALAEAVGYRRPVGPDGADAPFLEMDRWLAAVTLAMLATQSQVMGFGRPPPEDLVQRFDGLLAGLGEGARFFGNADYTTRWVKADPPPRHGSHGGEFAMAASWTTTISPGLSDATFDTGVVGVGDEVAFIVWAEEED